MQHLSSLNRDVFAYILFFGDLAVKTFCSVKGLETLLQEVSHFVHPYSAYIYLIISLTKHLNTRWKQSLMLSESLHWDCVEAYCKKRTSALGH